MATALRRSRPSRDFGLKLDPRVTHPPEILSSTPVTNEAGGFVFTTPGSSWNSSSSGRTSSSRKNGYAYSHHDYPSHQQSNCRSSQSTPSTVVTSWSASKITEHVYLGSEQDASCPGLLQDLGITHVLNLAVECLPSAELAKRSTFVGGNIPENASDMTSSSANCSPDLTDGKFETFPSVSPALSHASTMAPFDCHDTQYTYEPQFMYKYVPLRDDMAVSTGVMIAHLKECAAFIRSAVEKGENILVHCRMGVSRSATAVIAYLMLYGTNPSKPRKISFEEAMDIVNVSRPSINPNLAFGTALRELDSENNFRTHIWSGSKGK